MSVLGAQRMVRRCNRRTDRAKRDRATADAQGPRGRWQGCATRSSGSMYPAHAMRTASSTERSRSSSSTSAPITTAIRAMARSDTRYQRVIQFDSSRRPASSPTTSPTTVWSWPPGRFTSTSAGATSTCCERVDGRGSWPAERSSMTGRAPLRQQPSTMSSGG